MLSFETYWPLLLLAAIPYLWWVARRSLVNLTPGHLRTSTLVRSGVVVFLALALMQPVLRRTGTWISVIYLLDVSQSVAPDQILSAIEWIEENDESGQPEQARFIPFAANPRVFDSIEELRGVEVSDLEADGAIDQTSTNLEDAIDLAMGSFAPHHLKRLVILSDGNENAGTVKNTIRRMRGESVTAFTRPMGALTGPDVWIEEVLTPSRVTDQELFPLEVHVYSQMTTPGEVELLLAGETLEMREVDLIPGINRIAFEIRVSETGPVNIQAAVRVQNDTVPGNNVFLESVAVDGKPKVLYIEGRGESAHYLQDILVGEGIDVEVRTPGEIPLSVEEFDAFETIVLSDVRADAFTEGQMDALATYVRELGGGFILAGGDSVFGEDGYSETRIEEILPVSFDLEREPATVSLIIVLDKSGSMGGSKLELAKEASKAAVDVLEDDHLIGLVAFDYNHYWPVRLQPAERREVINQNISMIVAGGETNIYPALQEAHLALIDIDSEIKHVILLSDGRSLPDDFASLVEEMAAAEETVSTVAVGNGADRELLNSISDWGNGRNYFIEDAAMVPQIFTEETELATQGTLSERPFQAVVIKEVEALSGIDFDSSPPLLGYVSTLAKDTAEILLESDEEEPKPVLARWQYGLGKTLAFTSDVKDRWSAEWLTWDGYAKLWPQVVRETMRRGDNGQLDFVIEKNDDEAMISVRALNDDGSFLNELDAEVRVVAPSGNASVVELRQSGPGFYEATLPLDERGSYVFRLTGDDGGVSRVLPYSYPDEHHFYPPDNELLGELAASTGGIFDPDASDIFATGNESIVRPAPMWPYLAVVALLLYFTDLLLRRLRIFEEGA